MLKESTVTNQSQTSPTEEKPRPRRFSSLLSPGLAILLFFVSLYFLTGTYFTKGISDGEVMAQTAVALAQTGSVQLPASPGLPQIVPGKDGRYFSKYGLGQPLLAAGLYKTGQIFSRIAMPSASANIIGHFFIMLLPILATALTVWLLYLWAKDFYGSVKIGLGLALLYGLGTSAWPYTKVFFSEPVFTFCIFGTAFALWRANRTASFRTSYLWFAFAGFLLGYSLLTKISGLILLPAYLVYIIQSSRFQVPGFKFQVSSSRFQVQSYLSLIQNSKFAPKGWSSTKIQNLSLLFGLLPGLGLILLHNYVRFGNALNNGYDQEAFSTPFWQGLGGLLFSPGKSIFLYSPVLLVLPFALAGFWQKAKAETVLFGLISAITLLYYSFWWAWEGGWCWGPRFLVPLLPFLILPLGVLLQKGRVWVAVLFCGLLPVAIVVQMLGVALDFNTYLASIANNPALAPDVYIWSPEASPLLKHWSYFWQSSVNNTIRSLTLDQLGFRPRLGQLITVLMALLFAVSGALLCLRYFKAGSFKKQNATDL